MSRRASTIERRQFLALGAAMVGAGALGRGAWGAAYPERNIGIVVPTLSLTP